MTTIVYRDGILAADSRAYSGSSTPLGTKVKIRRLPSGVLIGCSTPEPGVGEAIMDWYADGAKPGRKPGVPENFSFIAVSADGKALMGIDSLHLTGPISAPWFAVGSGAQYAMTALHLGKTAREAVEIAAEFDPWTKPPILELTHQTEPTLFDPLTGETTGKVLRLPRK